MRSPRSQGNRVRLAPSSAPRIPARRRARSLDEAHGSSGVTARLWHDPTLKWTTLDLLLRIERSMSAKVTTRGLGLTEAADDPSVHLHYLSAGAVGLTIGDTFRPAGTPLARTFPPGAHVRDSDFRVLRAAEEHEVFAPTHTTMEKSFQVEGIRAHVQYQVVLPKRASDFPDELKLRWMTYRERDSEGNGLGFVISPRSQRSTLVITCPDTRCYSFDFDRLGRLRRCRLKTPQGTTVIDRNSSKEDRNSIRTMWGDLDIWKCPIDVANWAGHVLWSASRSELPRWSKGLFLLDPTPSATDRSKRTKLLHKKQLLLKEILGFAWPAGDLLSEVPAPAGLYSREQPSEAKRPKPGLVVQGAQRADRSQSAFDVAFDGRGVLLRTRRTLGVHQQTTGYFTPDEYREFINSHRDGFFDQFAPTEANG